MASRSDASLRPAQRWLRLSLRIFLVALVVVGCGFDLAGQGVDAIIGGEGGPPTAGPRADLFVIDPVLVTVDEGDTGTATFTVRLARAPSANVVVPMNVSPQGRITTEPNSLTFTPENFASAQTVTLKTTRNNELDPPDFNVDTGPATSADPLFNGADPVDVKIAFKDATREVIIVSPRTTPSGKDFFVNETPNSTAKFFVSLAAQPSDSVTVTIHVAPDSKKDLTIGTTDVGDGGIDAGDGSFGDTVTMTFPANTPVGVSKLLVLRGVDDGKQADGNNFNATVTFDPAVSGDKRFAGQTAAPLQVIAFDDDTANVLVSESSIVTTEPGGSQAFTVTLSTKPTSDVNITVVSDNPGEGKPSTGLLTFTPANWNIEQSVTVTGQQDSISDGPIGYNIKLGPPTSADPAYDRNSDGGLLLERNVTATNYDDDAIAVITSVQNPLQTTEGGQTASFSVRLQPPPFVVQGNIQLAVVSSLPGEATVSPAILNFDPLNSQVDQVVTVTGVNDNKIDGTKAYNVTVSVVGANTDPPYRLAAPSTIGGQNADNDSALVTVSPTTLSINEGSGTTFNIKLSSDPAQSVNVGLVVSTTGTPPLRPQTVTVPASVSLNSGNWSTGVDVNVSVPNDCWAQGPTTFNIATTVTSADANYNNIAASDVAVTANDFDTPNLISDVSSIVTTGQIDGSIKVTFKTRPQADVKLLVTTDTTSRVTLNGPTCPPDICVFVPSAGTTCPASQTVSVTGKNSPGTYNILIGPDNTTADPFYKGKSLTIMGTN